MEAVSWGSALPAWLLTTPALAPEGLIVILIGSCINAYVLIYIHAPLAVCIPISEWLFLLLAIIQKQHYSKYQKTVDYGMLQIWHPSRVTFKERQKAKIGYVSSSIWRCCVNFWKAIVGFYCFYRHAAVAQSHGFIKDRCTTMSSRSVSDVLMTETFTEEQLKI